MCFGEDMSKHSEVSTCSEDVHAFGEDGGCRVNMCLVRTEDGHVLCGEDGGQTWRVYT